MKKPGHVKFESDEIEFLMAHLLTACEFVKKTTGNCDPNDVIHRILDKVDCARFPNAVPLLIPPTTIEKGARAILKASRKPR